VGDHRNVVAAERGACAGVAAAAAAAAAADVQCLVAPAKSAALPPPPLSPLLAAVAAAAAAAAVAAAAASAHLQLSSQSGLELHRSGLARCLRRPACVGSGSNGRLLRVLAESVSVARPFLIGFGMLSA